MKEIFQQNNIINYYYSNNASISLYALLIMSFIIICIVGIFSLISQNMISQIKIENEISEYYNKSIDDEYEENKIPIENSNQIFLIGKDKNILLLNKIYSFSEEDYSKYKLVNDIVINICDVDYDQLLNFINIDKSNYEILYKYGNNYYIYKNYVYGSDIDDKVYIFKNNSIVCIESNKLEDNEKYIIFDITV